MRFVLLLFIGVSLLLPDIKADDESATVKQLLGDLKSQEAVKKRKAIKQLGAMGLAAQPAAPSIIALLDKDRDPLIRRASAEALGAIGGDRKATIRALSKAMKDSDAEVIATASVSMSKLGKDAVPVLREMLGESDSEIKRHAAEALARIGPDAKEAVPELLKAFQTENGNPRKSNALKANYAIALGNIGAEAKAAIPVFEAFLEQRTPDQQLRRVTTEALRKIKK